MDLLAAAIIPAAAPNNDPIMLPAPPPELEGFDVGELGDDGDVEDGGGVCEGGCCAVGAAGFAGFAGPAGFAGFAGFAGASLEVFSDWPSAVVTQVWAAVNLAPPATLIICVFKACN